MGNDRDRFRLAVTMQVQQLFYLVEARIAGFDERDHVGRIKCQLDAGLHCRALDIDDVRSAHDADAWNGMCCGGES